MTRRKKRATYRHFETSAGEGAVRPPRAAMLADQGRSGRQSERHVDAGRGGYEAAYSISHGYTAERFIVIP
jgi:hypothetical protein